MLDVEVTLSLNYTNYFSQLKSGVSQSFAQSEAPDDDLNRFLMRRGRMDHNVVLFLYIHLNRNVVSACLLCLFCYPELVSGSPMLHGGLVEL